MDDKTLGMNRLITRRDIIHGMGATAALTVAGPLLSACGQQGRDAATASAPYPPTRQGLRGSGPGSYDVAHKISWENWRDWGEPLDTGEDYDLVVVGGGISGLSAAYFYLRENPDARILVLDNHDDFGGHAKRNEVTVNGRLVLGTGGSQTLQDPQNYSPVATQLIREIGIDLDALYANFEHDFYDTHQLSSAIFFNAEGFGEDKLVIADLPFTRAFFPTVAKASIGDAAAEFPVAPEAQDQLARLFRADPELPNVPEEDLWSMTYADFVARKFDDPHPDVMKTLDRPLLALNTVISSEMPAGHMIKQGFPGNEKAVSTYLFGPYKHHFPDGNATVTRLLVQRLVPETTEADDMVSIIGATMDYGALDRDGADRRIRLNSTVVNVRHLGDPRTAESVEITYIQDGQAKTVRAGNAVLACYNMMIPHIWDEIPSEQREALAMNVKSPLIYATVVLNNWRAFKEAGVGYIYSPTERFAVLAIDFPTNIGAFEFANTPDEPVALHIQWSPVAPGSLPQDQYRAGRHEILAMTFEDFERDLRSHLQRALGPYGFSAADDIEAIFLNRHPHGYAPEPDMYGEVSQGQMPYTVRGRKHLGRIAIANSDAGGRAYVDGAIDQAWRALKDLKLA